MWENVTEVYIPTTEGIYHGRAFELFPSLTDERRFVFEVMKGPCCILDSRDLEPSYKGVPPAYPTLDAAYDACCNLFKRRGL